jgi:hypothetical protein
MPVTAAGVSLLPDLPLEHLHEVILQGCIARWTVARIAQNITFCDRFDTTFPQLLDTLAA